MIRHKDDRQIIYVFKIKHHKPRDALRANTIPYQWLEHLLAYKTCR